MNAQLTILKYVPEYLIDNLQVWTRENCQATPDEHPSPVAPDPFCSVHSTSVSRTRMDHLAIEEIWSFSVTVSRRLEAIPRDRVMPGVFVQQWQGIIHLAGQIMYLIDNRWKFINWLNSSHQSEYFDEFGAYLDEELSGNIDGQGFQTVAKFQNRNEKPVFRDEDWFLGWGKENRTAHDGHVGISMTLNFGELMFLNQYKEEVCP